MPETVTIGDPELLNLAGLRTIAKHAGVSSTAVAKWRKRGLIPETAAGKKARAWLMELAPDPAGPVHTEVTFPKESLLPDVAAEKALKARADRQLAERKHEGETLKVSAAAGELVPRDRLRELATKFGALCLTWHETRLNRLGAILEEPEVRSAVVQDLGDQYGREHADLERVVNEFIRS